MGIRRWQKNGWPESIPNRLMGSSWSVRYASAIAVVASATLLVALVRAALGYPPFLLLAGAVCIDAVFLGIGPAICALILATVASDFFFIEPTFAFSLNREVWRLSVLYCFGAIVSSWFRRRVAYISGRVPPR